ncbi:elongation factor G [Sphingomonas sp. RG327]|jgi:elongation factor G|uniref:Elongation factor G n=1 Tax=Sphingomonas anseongensis TaxID=2908207 RepID=A0ABT0RE18_9SPHN|nr:elongation factor G [Sphingomonas anseongensis]MCL6678524.1 elongation factor G [Sphingomonas anseongensis]
MPHANGVNSNGTRVIALVGPAGAGKTSVAEAILHAAGATDRHGSVGNGTSIGDSSPESRARGGSTELNLYNFDYLGDHFALIDCPGSVGFAADGARGLAVADLAIVIVDPDPARAPLAAPALRALDEQGIPHLIFVNRIDQAHGRIRDLLSSLQPVSVSPLIARQIPIREGDQITGFVDLALERAFHYNGKDSEQIDIPGEIQDREHEARNQMLEQLADHDDELLEQLLMDQTPDQQRILQDLARETGESLGVPVLFGSAESGWGMGRLLKALRHETPGPESTAARLEVSDPSLYIFKIHNGGTIGRLALARALGGRIGEGSDLRTRTGEHARLGAIFRVQGDKTQKVTEAQNGDIVAVAKIDNVKAGEWLGSATVPPPLDVQYPSLNCALAIEPADRKDDVKLSGALHRLLEEDAALILEQDEGAHEMRLRGINDEHLKTVLARLKRRYGVEVKSRAPTIGYRESIRKPVTQKGRHKKQSGGHGQFGDVIIEVKPLPRGSGFQFGERITGGAIPKQWIPAVEEGVRQAMQKGPLGFEVVDVAVTLVDGSYHSVDSSELAFRLAGRLAMSEALSAATPHLLEPMHKVSVVCPSSATSRVSSAVASRRGQMLGMAPRDGWTGWDRIDAIIPEAELSGMEAELRSQSQGLATYEAEFDHLAELNGPLADKVVQQRVPEPA